jgi:hypothetical protein
VIAKAQIFLGWARLHRETPRPIEFEQVRRDLIVALAELDEP